MPCYDIVLCSYNGSIFIEKQIRSILEQNIQPRKIIVSDDHSNDNTVELIKDVCHIFNFSNLEVIRGKKLGVIHNFLSSIELATSEYIFLSDQDDIWLPNKAEEFLSAFAKLDPSKPTLVFSDASLIDEDGYGMADSFFSYQGITSDIMADDSILYRNCVQGASCAINRNLQELIKDSLPLINTNNLYMHDWWIALLARYYGQYYFINKPLLQYRQHSRNQVGVFNKNFRLLYYITRFKIYFKNFKKAIKQAKEFEYFSYRYTKKNSILLGKEHRKYSSVSKIKVMFIKLLKM